MNTGNKNGGEKENIHLSIILGIFVGLAATLSLQSFLSYPLLEWLGYSIVVIVLSVLFIYLIIPTDSSSDKTTILNWLTIIAVTFFSFSLQKTDIEPTLPFWGLLLHAILIGILFVILSYKDKGLDHTRKITARVIGYILGGGAILWLLKYLPN